MFTSDLLPEPNFIYYQYFNDEIPQAVYLFMFDETNLKTLDYKIRPSVGQIKKLQSAIMDIRIVHNKPLLVMLDSDYKLSIVDELSDFHIIYHLKQNGREYRERKKNEKE